ncbi:oxidoreductase-like domain-containing protein [Fodinibius salsisoli]|uniref:Oxidoreductase-like domain-containing protein n=1 Tax=Fodinibius salsisoli TaxID=2820877 RepID=A0ABT3PJS0_9BACT|nr:hypothetical protein [Fodinibius salsisoli]
MKKPEPPLPTDCCGSGCTRCVYDMYKDHLAIYKEWKKEQEEKKNKEIKTVEK